MGPRCTLDFAFLGTRFALTHTSRSALGPRSVSLEQQRTPSHNPLLTPSLTTPQIERPDVATLLPTPLSGAVQRCFVQALGGESRGFDCTAVDDGHFTKQLCACFDDLGGCRVPLRSFHPM